MEEILAEQEVIVIGSKAIDRPALLAKLRPDQVLIDLVNVDRMTLNVRAAHLEEAQAA
jgi:hypothetical protein